MKKLLTSLLLFVAATSFSQQLPLYSHYWSNPFLVNPGFTGNTDNIEANLIHRNQWKNIPGAPVTSVLSLDGMTRDNKVGLGLIVFDDKMGLFARRGIYTSYSYKIQVAPDHYIKPGINFGMQDVMIDFARANVSDNTDPNLYPTSRRKTTFDANFGVAYTWKELNAGVAVMQLFGNKYRLNNDTGSYYLSKQRINVYASYVATISEAQQIHARPVLALNVTPGTPVQADIFANFDYKEMIYAGVGYRLSSAVSFNIGVKWNKALRVSYNYDLAVGKIKGYTGGSHEILLGYSFGKSGGGEKEPKDFSAATPKDADTTGLRDEMNKLKQQMAILQAEVNYEQRGNLAAQVADDIVIMNAKDIKDYNGNVPEKGYYLILGQFKTLQQATEDQKKLEAEGVKVSMLVHSIKGYYVYSQTYPDEKSAMEALKQNRWKRVDSYLLELK
jgi:type IX secretion system PorP/SprF family membrane protein